MSSYSSSLSRTSHKGRKKINGCYDIKHCAENMLILFLIVGKTGERSENEELKGKTSSSLHNMIISYLF